MLNESLETVGKVSKQSFYLRIPINEFTIYLKHIYVN